MSMRITIIVFVVEALEAGVADVHFLLDDTESLIEALRALIDGKGVEL